MVDCEPKSHVRLQLLRLQLSIETEDFELSSMLLNNISMYFTDETRPIGIIYLPNQMHCNAVDQTVIAGEIELIKCLHPQQEHRTQQQRTLEMLLTLRQNNFESKYLSTFQQIEMLMEIFWYDEQFAKCLHWCEIGLHVTVRCWWLKHKMNRRKSVALALLLQHIRFMTAYLEHLCDASNQYGMCKYTALCEHSFHFI